MEALADVHRTYSPRQDAANNAAVAVLDKITADNTAFKDFADLLNTSPNYRPSIKINKKLKNAGAMELLAMAYDQAMTEMGDERRAYVVRY